MILKVILEGLILGGLMAAYCAFGIKDGAVGMVYLYHTDVQERCIRLGLTTREEIRRRSLQMKCAAVPAYFALLLISVYGVNGARGFAQGFWQMAAILQIVNLIDRLLIDEYWVGHTGAWTIPGTEDLKPYIDGKDKRTKWLMGIFGYTALAAGLAAIMAVVMR